MPEAAVSGARFQAQLLTFLRTLRAAGLSLGPGDSITAMEVVCRVGLGSREDLRDALAAVLVRGPRDRELFRIAFAVFFGDPGLLDRLGSVAAESGGPGGEPTLARLAEALGEVSGSVGERRGADQREADRSRTASALEVLRRKDFEQMTLAEQSMAHAALRETALSLPPIPSRRYSTHATGRRPDLRATMRRSLREGGEFVELRRRRRRVREPALVVLCDISGSMSGYTRMFLHFTHALTAGRGNVHTFLFGTRLTPITRRLRDRDPDRALARVSDEIRDWDGGTRIAAALGSFNREWGRRVLGQGAVVLLLTDGLERDPGITLESEMERLAKSSRRLIWLNPLLRYDGFEPLAGGMRRMLPHVDELVPAHDIASLAELAARLAGPLRATGRAA